MCVYFHMNKTTIFAMENQYYEVEQMLNNGEIS